MVHPSASTPVAPATYFCPKKHTLNLTPRLVIWYCDLCNAQHNAGEQSFFCQSCDYDLCLKHMPEMASQPAPILPPFVAPTPAVPRTLLTGASAASLQDVQTALNNVASPMGFRCVPVSWEDAQRGTVGGNLSCWGPNISDVRLYEKSNKLLYTLRTNNWNERLGYVSTKELAVVTGNHVPGGSQPTAVTLERYLQNISEYGSYAGIGTPNLFHPGVDGVVSIRFQTVFLPIPDTNALGTVEFCTEVYNYNTRSDDDPRNLLLLCTPQGTSVQQDGSKAKKVYYHSVEAGPVTHMHWLEAERSRHVVGQQQVETTEEAALAASRGKATAIHIGTRAMGTRFNVQLLIQVPLQQKPRPAPMPHSSGGWGGAFFGAPCMPMMQQSNQCYQPTAMCAFAPPPPAAAKPQSCFAFGASPAAAMKKCRASPVSSASQGTSNAARVSRGSVAGVFSGVANRAPARDPSQHATVTVTMYYTVAGGVPTPADVTAAIADLDVLYRSCASDKRLVQCPEVTTELTVATMSGIQAKVTQQPYTPAPMLPANNAGGFPGW